jgi:two-component system NtrC family sensor kinase
VSDENPPVEFQKKPPARRRFSLQRKFLLGVGLIFLGFCLVSAFLIYLHEKRLLVEAAHEKSEMVMAAVEASRNYVREVLRPKMYEILGKDAFVLEAMSTSYVSRAITDRFKGTMPDYQIRRVALHARNPASEPNPSEIDLIKFFAEHPQQQSWQGIVKIGGRPNFLHSRPVYFKQSCMHCHGDPADAPQALLDLYGRERGFGYKLGDMAGVTTVSIPVDIALAKIKERAIAVFGISLFFLSLLYVGINFFFNRVVVHNLRDLLEIFRHGLRDEKELQLLTEAKAKDEIGEVTAAAQVMVGHLHNTRQQLEKYAENLEVMVAQRTEALKESQHRLQEKVAARKRELQTLNTIAELITGAVNLADILPKVLLQTLKLIPARGAALYLLQDNPARLELQCQENAGQLIAHVPIGASQDQSDQEKPVTDLPSSLLEATCGRMSFFACEANHNCLNVPLVCRGNVLGVMTFVEVDFNEITSEMRELLLSIGQQIGITIESLQNIEKLVHSKDLLQSVFDGISGMMVLLDRDLRIKMVNKAYLQHYGVTLEEVLNQPYSLPDTGRGCPFPQGNVEAVFQLKKAMTEEVQGKDGKIFRVRYYPIFDDKGEVVSIVRSAKDITAEKRVEHRIQHTEKMASLGQLAGGIAHEINNPLGVILCYVDLLRSQLADFPHGLIDLAIIEKHARNCQRIVSDLLKFARGQETERQLAALNPTIEEVVQMVDHQFRWQHCEIEQDLDPNLPMVRIDVDKMRQVYLNLLMNAQQARKDRGKIRISTRYLEHDRQVQIVFWDNGVGIHPEVIDRIFDPFFSTKKTGEGTGLGLSVSYGIIKDHGGDIQVESELGHWTRFTIILPVDEQG